MRRADGAATASGRAPRVFRSLAVPNYRRFFAGQAVSIIGTWMQRVAQDWLVLQLTDSALAVGVGMSLQFLPMLLFGLWGGVLVDRLDRRRCIIVTQAMSGALAALLAALVLTDLVSLWMVYALAFGLGLVAVVDIPARHAFITEMVGPEDYINAQALNAAVQNAGRLIGPAVAGLLIGTIDVGAAFAVNAVSFAALLIGLIRMDPRQLRERPPPVRQEGAVREGLKYVWRHPQLRSCIVLVAVVSLLGQNFRVVLPLLARDSFGSGAEGYGWLTSALGAGAILGALASAARQRVTAGALIMWTGAFAVVNLGAAVTPGLGIALPVMVALGIANISVNTLARSLIQLGTDAAMQGRVIALHGLVFFGSTPLGAPITGWVCEQWGPRAGLLLAGLSTLLGAVAVRAYLRPHGGGIRRRPRAEPLLPHEASSSNTDSSAPAAVPTAGAATDPMAAEPRRECDCGTTVRGHHGPT